MWDEPTVQTRTTKYNSTTYTVKCFRNILLVSTTSKVLQMRSKVQGMTNQSYDLQSIYEKR